MLNEVVAGVAPVPVFADGAATHNGVTCTLRTVGRVFCGMYVTATASSTGALPALLFSSACH
jgi:hypothetical protein